MFTYQAGEPLEASKRKTELRALARKEWPFLTPLDLTMIKSEIQLSSMVKDRSGRTKSDAEMVVRNWMERQKLPKEFPAGQANRQGQQHSWENEGGALST